MLTHRSAQMQAQLRSEGKETIDPTDYKRFIDMHTNEKLLKAEQPGHVIAALATKGTRETPGGLGAEGAFSTWNEDVFSGEWQLSA